MKILKKVAKLGYFLFRNFFFSTGFFLLVWMFTFDGNDFINQWRITQNLRELEEEKKYYISKIEEVKKEKEEIFGSIGQIEKFAREHYLMKKPSENIYLVRLK